MNWDLNCDLGEGERNTAGLLRCVTSANIACGGHAGDLRTMRRTIRLALASGVKIGAHPGIPDRAGFGRVKPELSTASFGMMLVQQISAMKEVLTTEAHAVQAQPELHHVKLHGALYHLLEESAALRKNYLQLIAEFWPEVVIFARAGGKVVRDAERARLAAWPEGFLDRAYHRDGRLVPRGESNAVLTPPEFKERLRCVAAGIPFLSVEGFPVEVKARTWCIHGDSAEAGKFARMARKALIN